MLLLYNTKLGAFWEIFISRAASGGRREIELNSGSLPPIPGGLATLDPSMTHPLPKFPVDPGPNQREIVAQDWIMQCINVRIYMYRLRYQAH